MNCLCINEKNFIFTINFYKDYFVFNDFSDWVSSSQDDVIKTQDKVKLKVKKDNQEIVLEFLPNRSTVFKYDKLIKSDCGYDGFYTFTVVTCNNTQEIDVQYPILESIHCAYNQLIVNERFDEALELLKYIELITANTYFKDIKTAKAYLDIAVRFIKKIKCTC